MLAASHRLRKPREIARVYKRGVYGGSGLVSVKAAPNGRAVSRAVVVVGKKVDKRAVVRNRCRRKVLGYLESNWATLGVGYDIVVSVHSDISALETAKLATALDTALQKAKLRSSNLERS